jgi:hypothetical protein
MMAAFLLLLAGAAGYGGFACLALAMPDHWARAGGAVEDHARRGRRLRLAGALMLCVALAICIWRDGASFGAILWVILLTASAIGVALTLTWRPRWLLWRSRAGGRSTGTPPR